MGYDLFEVSFLIVDDEEMRRLNKAYRGLARTTDVLSFPQYRFFRGELIEPVLLKAEKEPLGDVVISLETIERRSRGKRDFYEYLLRTIIHGLLHLMGFDHKDRGERKVMRECEELMFKIYKKGFGL